MLKHLTAFRACPTLVNARRLTAYAAKHPMTLCALSWDDLKTLEAARDHAANPGAAAEKFFARAADSTRLQLTNGGGMVEAK